MYDVIWSLAIALNETVSMIEEGNTSINGTGCEGLPGSLVPLEHFSYDNELVGCLIQRNLQQTNFSGVSVSNLMFNYCRYSGIYIVIQILLTECLLNS